MSNPVPVTDDLRELTGLHRAEPKELAAELTVPHYFGVGYEFGQVDQILELEFTKLLEADIRFRKCQRCVRSRYEAMRLRDDCEDGKIPVEEYKRWMEKYFPNRKRAGDSGPGEYKPPAGMLPVGGL